MPDPKIFYLAYDHATPSGGQKATYQHVDTLLKNGLDAYVVHARGSAGLKWFANASRVVRREEFSRLYSPRDFIVLPEDLGMDILWIPGKKVIYNKGIALGFRALGIGLDEPTPYEHPEVVAILAASPHNAQHLAFACPDKDVYTTYLPIDSDLFSSGNLANKEALIAYVPKNPGLLSSVLNLAKCRSYRGLNVLSRFTFVQLGSLSRTEYVSTLSRALVLMFLNIEEGKGGTSVEAMASGCLIVGCGPSICAEVSPPHDQLKIFNVVSIVERLERIASFFPSRMHVFEDEIASGRAYASTFSFAKHEASVISAWQQILTKWGARTV